MNKNCRSVSMALWVFLLFFLNSGLFLLSQMPEFMNRLAGGKIAGKDFKESVDFELVGGWICIKACFNDEEQEHRFILDTYNICLVRESLLNVPGLDILDETAQLGSQFEKTPMKPIFPKFKKIRIGKVLFEDIGAMVLRGSSGNAVESLLEEGLIGANLMKHCIWQIDFQNYKILLTDRIESCKGLENAIQIPFIPKPIQSSPDIQVIFGGKEKVSVQFDTGSTGFLSLLTPALKTLVESGKAVAWRASLDKFIEDTSATKIETNYFVRAPSVQIGSKIFEDIPVAVFNPGKGELMNRGSLGMEFLKNFIVTMDWTENTIYLTPIKGRELKRNIRTFGFTYGYENDAMRVRSLYEGSQAERLGMQIGDQIYSVNGVSVENLTEDQILRFRKGNLIFSREEDESITLEVQISGKKARIKLAAYDLFAK